MNQKVIKIKYREPQRERNPFAKYREEMEMRDQLAAERAYENLDDCEDFERYFDAFGSF